MGGSQLVYGGQALRFFIFYFLYSAIGFHCVCMWLILLCVMHLTLAFKVRGELACIVRVALGLATDPCTVGYGFCKCCSF